MSTSATIRLYDLLRVKLGENEARSFVRHFEESIEEKFEEKKDVLATKLDVAELRSELVEKIAESRAEMIKWMFIFWIGGIGVLASLTIAVAKGLIR
jgi:uncharacterized Rmd1/YagE family protein